MASDGTALKPGLEYDSVQKEIVGASINIDADYVERHRQPVLQKIKGTLVSEVHVIFLTKLDDKTGLPVSMYYMPRSMSGDECYT